MARTFFIPSLTLNAEVFGKVGIVSGTRRPVLEKPLLLQSPSYSGFPQIRTGSSPWFSHRQGGYHLHIDASCQNGLTFCRRELALQISEQFAVLGASLNTRTAVVVGGMDMIAQALELENRPHVVVATPGRIVDHLKSSHGGWDFSRIKFLVSSAGKIGWICG